MIGLIARMSVTVLVTVAMHGYFWVRLVRDTALPPRARRAATGSTRCRKLPSPRRNGRWASLM